LRTRGGASCVRGLSGFAASKTKTVRRERGKGGPM
jgi:hypothetical protein